MGYAAILFLIRHRNAVLSLAALWAAAGFWITLRTPMDAVPDLSENQVLVYADWHGQSPPEIERRITRPLSLALQGIPGIRAVRGSSDVGMALLHLIFSDDVSFPEARARVGSRLASLDVEFPPEVVPRMAADGIPTGQIYWYTVEGAQTDLAELRTLQDTIVAPQLRAVPGVAEVASIGGFVEEYHVEPDLARLASLGLTLTDLESALRDVAHAGADQVLNTPTAEFLVRTVAPHAAQTEATAAESSAFHDLQQRILVLRDGRSAQLQDLARVVKGAAPRRGVFEKDGNEAVAGIVHLRYGFNPLEVTRAVRRRLQEIGDLLPSRIRIVPCYDRTPLILGGVETVARTLLESLLVASLCVVLVLRHWRTSLVITLILPLAVLGAFLGIWALRAAGWADVQTNIMSLAGIVVSIGVLVDSSIVVAENVTHQLRQEFGDTPVSGDVSEIVAKACSTVGVPAFCAVLIMIVSFLPVFALEGIDGRMYRPLAWTKTLALLSAAILTVTLVPVLCAVLIRGRVRAETDSALVRSIVGVYRPVLSYLMDHPLPLVVLLSVTFIAGAAATGVDPAVRSATAISIGLVCWLAAGFRAKALLTGLLIIVGLATQSSMRPIGLALRLPLDEGMIMDMPITVPRIPVSQAVDDLKARNMVLCRFPEVQMVAGKSGRAETPFDPAPVDMIETMVEFRPKSWWPRRRLLRKDAERQTADVVSALTQAGLVEAAPNPSALVEEIVDAGLIHFDAVTREVCWQRLQPFQSELSRDLAARLTAELSRRLVQAGVLTKIPTDAEIRGLAIELPLPDVHRLGQQPQAGAVHSLLVEIQQRLDQRGWLKSDAMTATELLSAATRFGNAARAALGLERVGLEEDLLRILQAEFARRWSDHVSQLNVELRWRAAGTWTQIVCSELFLRQPILDDALVSVWKQVLATRYRTGNAVVHHDGRHAGMPSYSPLPIIDPHPVYDALVKRLTENFSRRVWLWPHDAESLCRNSGEMDRSVQMPGWANVWTRPIQNRVDMLSTGVNSEVGVRVLGRHLDDVVRVSEDLAAVLRKIPGAADVVADPIRGKGYVDVVPDSLRAAREGVALADVKQLIGTAISGRIVTRIDDGIAARAVRMKLPETFSAPNDALLGLPVPVRLTAGGGGAETTELGEPLITIPLSRVADIRVGDGPATIKSENGWLRNYVRLNVRDRDPAEFVAAAQRQVQQTFALPPGVFLEWTGQFEHAARTRRMMLWMVPLVSLLILAILYAAFRDFADAALMILSVPGALAGGVLCQWLLGFPFSIAVGVGYIACFGMAAATSMVMLVYLREAEAQAGGLERMSLADLRAAVMSGAVHRLRPKLLTETTTLLSLAPMLWSAGVGADVIRPMAAPVLGGILIADEVVDLLLPVAFYAVRRYRWRRLNATSSREILKEPSK